MGKLGEEVRGMDQERTNAHQENERPEARLSFRERYPNFPLWLSLIALICSIAMPILREFLA